MKTRAQIIWIGLLSLSAQLISCGEETAETVTEAATDTATSCADSDLIAQCPPGTQADLSAMATGECSGEGDANLINQEGAVSASCAGSGSCRVLCRFDDPCECGVERITRDELVCNTQCGNTCVEGAERCNGQHREVCSPSGVWDQLDCVSGTQCVERDGGTTCQDTCEEMAWYPDVDGDTYGDATSSVLACEAPEGHVSNGDDCDDSDVDIHPDAAELCADERDNNCDGEVDCQDRACSMIEACVEGGCADGIDNDEDGAIDCAEVGCEASPECAAECVELCDRYDEVCPLEPARDEPARAECRRVCAQLEPASEDLPPYASNTLECHELYLEVAENDTELYCERAQVSESNPYCTTDGRFDCQSYCLMMRRDCPSVYGENFFGCLQSCRGFSGITIDAQDVARPALECRLDALKSLSTTDGGACERARADNESGCPTHVTLNLVSTGDRPQVLSFSRVGDLSIRNLILAQGSAITFRLGANLERAALTVRRLTPPQMVLQEASLSTLTSPTFTQRLLETGSFQIDLAGSVGGEARDTIIVEVLSVQ